MHNDFTSKEVTNLDFDLIFLSENLIACAINLSRHAGQKKSNDYSTVICPGIILFKNKNLPYRIYRYRMAIGRNSTEIKYIGKSAKMKCWTGV